MASRSTSHLHPDLVSAFNGVSLKWANLYPEKPQPFLTCTHRSNQEQNDLYAQGRTKPGPKVTNAQAGQSPHNFMPALAFDIAFKKADGSIDWNPVYFKEFARLIGLQTDKAVWGGNFRSMPDSPHFELKDWKSLKHK